MNIRIKHFETLLRGIVYEIKFNRERFVDPLNFPVLIVKARHTNCQQHHKNSLTCLLINLKLYYERAPA